MIGFNLKSKAGSLQLAFFVALLSVLFQQWQDLVYASHQQEMIATAVMWASTLIYLVPHFRRLATVTFVLAFLTSFATDWYAAANHTWLALWLIGPAALFKEWWEEPMYFLYLRLTVGAVLFLSSLQKIASGHYLDGSYLAWLSENGSTTERAFHFLCSTSYPDTCGWYVLMGVAAVAWQMLAGLLLLFGFKKLIFILIEVGFLVFVGLFADEMNFQVLNVAILCIAFNFGMKRLFAAACISLLVVDQIGIGHIIEYLWHHLS